MTLRMGTGIWQNRLTLAFKLLLVFCLLGSISALPGCGGCRTDPIAKKKADEEAKKKKKKKDLEKPKPNFEPLQVRMLPSNDPTPTEKNPAIRVKPGHWIALSESTKANNFDFLGELATYPEARGTLIPQPLEIDNTNSRVSVWRPASLPKGQIKHFESLVFVPKRPAVAGSTYALRSELHGVRGGRTEEFVTSLSQSLKEHEHLLIVLSTNPAS